MSYLDPPMFDGWNDNDDGSEEYQRREPNEGADVIGGLTPMAPVPLTPRTYDSSVVGPPEPSPFEADDSPARPEPQLSPPSAQPELRDEKTDEERTARLEVLRWEHEHYVVSDGVKAELAELESWAREVDKPAWMRGAMTLDTWFAEPEEPECHRIEGLSLCDGRTLVFGRHKAGKTNVGINIGRSLTDNTPLFDRFEIEPLDGRVGYLNYELTRGQFRAWCHQHGFLKENRMLTVNLRGCGAYLSDDLVMEFLAELLNEQEVQALIVDNLLASMAPGEDPNRHVVASTYTSRLEALQRATGVSDVYLLAHTGHPTRFGKGGIPLDSRVAHSSWFMGWPDDYWSWLADDAGTRYLEIKDGRAGTATPPQAVSFDEATRRLTMATGVPTLSADEAIRASGGTPKTSAGEDLLVSEDQIAEEILDYLRGRVDVRQTELFGSVSGLQEIQQRVRDGLVSEGLITAHRDGRSRLHNLIEGP